MKTHYKKLRNPNFIGSYELMQGETTIDLNVKITVVKTEMVQNGDNQEGAMIMHLEGQKPMIVNSTNAKTITKLIGSPYVEDWIGKIITLYVAKVRAFGEMHDALRVRPQLPQQQVQKTVKKEELTPKSERWNGAKDSLKTGGVTMEQIKNAFILSPENEKLLTDFPSEDEDDLI